MIWAFLKATSFGIPRWVLVLGAFALLVLVAYLYVTKEEEADDARNQAIGATVERERALEETVTRVEKANETRNEIESDIRAGGSDRLYRQCLSSNRGAPENCQRFLPH